MWQQIDKLTGLFLIVALPLLWGLGVEYMFELLRRRRVIRGEEDREDTSV